MGAEGLALRMERVRERAMLAPEESPASIISVFDASDAGMDVGVGEEVVVVVVLDVAAGGDSNA